MVPFSGTGFRDIFRVICVEVALHWAPLRRRAAGWPHWSGDVRGRRPRTGSNFESLSTTAPSSHRDKHFYLLNFLSNVNRAAYKCRAEIYAQRAPRPRKASRLLPDQVDGGEPARHGT